ncbi:hypothetical protein A9176_06840 [Leuconostoc garlicum]|uniref:KAP NTPase domain-containing protein n=1 Tax=Leuconostoc garlicum TaxID=255248 RepID=A0ABN4WNY3_9LACO|nr:P-loop NTPase fold protein [Leuconostoc garlicum]AQN80080.1 hypothetical protein A9176_06840 [Leuconostoc garlicum]
MSKKQLNVKFFEDEIDTNQSARNFTQLLKEKQTIFLNGEWGTGKSTFLKNVEENSVKNQKKIFVFMDLWRTDTSQSLITTAFRKLIPRFYWLTRILIVASIIVSILMTGVIKVPFIFSSLNNLWDFVISYSSKLNILPFILFISNIVARGLIYIQFLGIFLVLFVSVSQLLKINYFEFDAYLFSRHALKNKVLVIDDFDRLTASKQKDAYKLFSFLNGKLPIIFVGSYDRIIENDETEIFLSKIIDRRVDLPIVLWPSEIWTTVFKFIYTKFGINLSEEFKEIFIDEQKNLRDRMHFIDYMEQELIIRNKLNHVQIEDQLIIIYTYLFHYTTYNKLLINKNHIFTVLSELEKSKSPFDLVLYSILNKSKDQYPVQFKKNPGIYFLFEAPTNLTASEIEEQLQNDDKLNEYLMAKSNSDFFNYITSSFRNLNKPSQTALLNASLSLFNKQYNSDVIKFLVSEKDQKILPYKVPIQIENGGGIAYSVPEDLVDKSDEEIYQIRYEKWRPILQDAQYDISQQLKFFVTFHITGLKYLNGCYGEIPSIVKSCSVNDYVSPEYILLEYISELNQWYLFSEWEDVVWEYIKKLPLESLITFLKYQDVVRKSENKDPKDYILMKASHDFDNGGLRDNIIIIEKIEERLKKLENNNYILKKDTD